MFSPSKIAKPHWPIYIFQYSNLKKEPQNSMHCHRHTIESSIHTDPPNSKMSPDNESFWKNSRHRVFLPSRHWRGDTLTRIMTLLPSSGRSTSNRTLLLPPSWKTNINHSKNLHPIMTLLPSSGRSTSNRTLLPPSWNTNINPSKNLHPAVGSAIYVEMWIW